MASSSGVQLQQQQYEATYQCKECGFKYNSSESLNIHLQYTHKDNLLSKWAAQAASSHPSEETNNNKPSMKREFLSNTIAAAADSSDATTMHNKKSPEYGSRTTPETAVNNFGHPPTPQSYQSASSPYQNNTTPNDFSPGFQNYQTIKQERISPHYHQNYNPYPAENQFFTLNPQQENYVDYVPKVPNSSFRYHPYQQQTPYNNPQVSSSSPAYPPQPTPSPSPKQCDKCGYFCETATQLIEHLNNTHPPTPAYQQPPNNFIFPKTEEEQQSDILDLDSHKVHQVYPEDEKRALPNWHQQPRLYTNGREVFPSQDQKLFTAHQDYMSGGSVTTTQAEVVQNYRPFELPPQPAMPVTSSTQPAAPPTTTTKSANWKSNEARRPKTYNCTACNKWFTSSGHLKRHYNTTLHKNAVKSSGQPDPATLPISAHHHPARDSASNREEVSPNEDSRGDDNSMPPVMYERQPPAPLALPNLPSPPNGEAGPSATTIDSRGLLPFTHHPGFSPSMESNQHHQFQMYPNVSAPHVTQLTATSSHNTTGEYQQQYLDAMTISEPQPLPSFEQIQRYSGGAAMGLLGTANVGGAGPVTAPYSLYQNEQLQDPEPTALIVREGSDDYHLLLNVVHQATDAEEEDILQYSPTTDNNNHKTIQTQLPIQQSPPSPEKAKTKTDYEDSSSQITSTVPLTTTTTTATAKQIHKCFDCDKIFNKACYLTQHNKTFHSGDKPFKCQRCGKRFSIDKIYEEHIKKHAGDKPYKCNQCPKQFNHKTDLRRHMCLHTGQKPFSCDTCGKGFIRKDHMLKHCETHTRRPHATKGAAVVR